MLWLCRGWRGEGTIAHPVRRLNGREMKRVWGRSGMTGVKKRKKISKVILEGMKTNSKEMKRLSTWNNNKYGWFFFSLGPAKHSFMKWNLTVKSHFFFHCKEVYSNVHSLTMRIYVCLSVLHEWVMCWREQPNVSDAAQSWGWVLKYFHREANKTKGVFVPWNLKRLLFPIRTIATYCNIPRS